MRNAQALRIGKQRKRQAAACRFRCPGAAGKSAGSEAGRLYKNMRFSGRPEGWRRFKMGL